MGSQFAELIHGRTVRGKIHRVLATLFVVMLISTAGYLAHSQRVLVEGQVERQARDLADGYFDNIHTLMLTGGMANRDVLRNTLLSRPDVIDAHIMRGPAVAKGLGSGGESAPVVDDLGRRALVGETVSEIRDGAEGRVLTVLVPLRAGGDLRGSDCTGCHAAGGGEILGAVRVDYSLQAVDAAVSRNRWIHVAINSTLMIIGLVVVGALFTRIASRPLQQIDDAMCAVAEGNADWSRRLEVKSNDEIGSLAGHLNTVIGRFGGLVEETKRRSDAATRLEAALGRVSTSVMLADGDNNIVYLNQSAQALFREVEKDLRERLPRFDADKLIGCSMNVFHADPDQQRSPFAALDDGHESRFELGDRTLRVIANPVFDGDGSRLGTAVEWADLTAELRAADEEARRVEVDRRQAEENLRIRTALDNVSNSVMVADQDFNIVYMNKALACMFGEAEDELRKALPTFAAADIVGSNMDVFHKSPSHQRHMLEQMSSTVASEMTVAGLTLRVVANPVLDADGNRLGTVVEWANRTAEVAVEQEINGIVAAARRGDLGQRIALHGKEGFSHRLAEGINALVGELDSVFDDIVEAMQNMAEGDLTKPITRDYAGAYGQVKRGVNATIEHIERIVHELREATDAITTSANEIASGNNNLSSRTEQQAAALEQTAASMEQLTSTVRNNADNAQQASLVAADASQLAGRGGDVVGRAVSAMEEINASSNKIAEIIGVIDDISFQTNLLALNASVEAARAGEQGRGFAVVATEVRNLASRSANAAKEIKDLIQDSVEKVQSGSGLVHESGQTLEDIVNGVKKVNDIIAEIAAASAEQSAGIDQVNLAVTSMDEVTQQNAALAEQTSAASASLSDKADGMMQLMSFFKVSGLASATPLKRASRPAPTILSTPSTALGVPMTVQTATPRAVAAAPAPAGRSNPLPAVPPAGITTDDDDEWEEF